MSNNEIGSDVAFHYIQVCCRDASAEFVTMILRKRGDALPTLLREISLFRPIDEGIGERLVSLLNAKYRPGREGWIWFSLKAASKNSDDRFLIEDEIQRVADIQAVSQPLDRNWVTDCIRWQEQMLAERENMTVAQYREMARDMFDTNLIVERADARPPSVNAENNDLPAVEFDPSQLQPILSAFRDTFRKFGAFNAALWEVENGSPRCFLQNVYLDKSLWFAELQVQPMKQLSIEAIREAFPLSMRLASALPEFVDDRLEMQRVAVACLTKFAETVGNDNAEGARDSIALFHEIVNRLNTFALLGVTELENTSSTTKMHLPSDEAVPPEPMSNGPIQPNEFRWNGKTVTLEPIPFKLLAAVWNADNQRIAEDDVAEIVWPGADASKNKIGSAKQKANAALTKAGYIKTISSKAGYLLIS